MIDVDSCLRKMYDRSGLSEAESEQLIVLGKNQWFDAHSAILIVRELLEKGYNVCLEGPIYQLWAIFVYGEPSSKLYRIKKQNDQITGLPFGLKEKGTRHEFSIRTCSLGLVGHILVSCQADTSS